MEFILDVPDRPTTAAVVFLPGISGGAFSDRFQPLVEACLEAGFAIARVSAWKDAKDVEQRNLNGIYRDLGEVTTYLHAQGYSSLFGIGKSFGGAVMLTFPSTHIRRKVLWAPAIGVAEDGATIDAYMSAALGSLRSLLDLTVDRAYLEKKDTPALIIHGTADANIPFSNSERLVSMLPNARLLSIEGADHSYSEKKHEEAVILATVNFLTETQILPPSFQPLP